MKTMKSILLFILILSSGLISAQEFTNSSNTFLHLSFVPPTEVFNKLDPYEPATTREKESFENSKKYFQGLVVNHFIKFIYDELEQAKGIQLQPINAMRDYIDYDKDGMPLFIIAKSAINSVMKNGYETDYFFKFDIGAEINIIMKGLAGQVKPNVTCGIKVWDKSKKVVKKANEKYKSKSAIKLTYFPKSKFDKLDDGYMRLLFEKIKPQWETVVKAAINDL